MAGISENRSRITGAAVLIMAATLLSRLTGFLRQLLISSIMKPCGYSDQFILSLTLPDIVYDLLAGGAIAAALIPVLSSCLAKGKEETGWKAVGTFMNITIVLVIFLELIFFIWTDGLVGIFAAGYNDAGAEDKALVIRLTRILLLNAPFMMLAGQLNGILNSYKRFAMAAFGPVLYNICTILSIILFGGISAEATSWGFVGSAAVFFAIQFAATFRHFRSYTPRLYLGSKAFRRLVSLAVPSLISSLIFEVNLIITRGYATYMDEGMLTLLTNANKTWQLPLGIFAQSIGIALLPTLSEHHAARSDEEFRSVLGKGIRIVFLLSLPTALFMMILNQDIMRVLFKWGPSTESDVFYSGVSLFGYSLAVVFASMTALLNRAFYAVHNSRIPMFAGIVGIAVNFLANMAFKNLSDVGIAGVALAYSISAFVNIGILMFMFNRITGINILIENGRYAIRTIFAAIPAGLAVFLLSVLIRPDVNSKLSQIICILVSAAPGVAIFWYVSMKLRISEIEYVNDTVRSFIGRLRSRA
jgi:putative peptidoglycan lipid II flippase